MTVTYAIRNPLHINQGTGRLARVAAQGERFLVKLPTAFQLALLALLLPGVSPLSFAESSDDCVSLDADVPEDVAQFRQLRCLCYHFLGEEPYDADRKAFLSSKINETCGKLLKRCEELRTRYAGQSAVLQLLTAEYATAQCPAARKKAP